MKVDYNEIINGTLQKRLFNGYNALKESGLSEETAREYKSIYENASLIEILENSEMIFKEPIMGLHFYEKVIMEHKIPLHRIDEQLDTITEFYQSHKDDMVEVQESALNNTINKIQNIRNGRRRMINLMMVESESILELTDKFCESLYQGESLEDSYNTFVTECTSPYAINAYELYTLPTDRLLFSRVLVESIKPVEEMELDINVFESVIRNNMTISYLLEDSITKEEATNKATIPVKFIIENVKALSCPDMLSEIYTESIEGNRTSDINSILSLVLDDPSELTESVNQDIAIIASAKAHKLYNTLSYLAYCEADNNDGEIPEIFSFLEGCRSIQEVAKYTAEKTYQLEEMLNYGNYVYNESAEDEELTLEYTRRGEATPTIRKSAGNIRETVVDHIPDSKRSKETTSDDDGSDESEDD